MRGGLCGSLSLMYSSMHSPGMGVNRVERTLLNFFMRSGVRVGFFGVPGRRFAGDFEVAARRTWAVLPRNSGVFGQTAGAAIQRTADTGGHSGRKIFKNLLERGEKPKNWGARGVGGWSGRTLYRVRGDF